MKGWGGTRKKHRNDPSAVDEGEFGVRMEELKGEGSEMTQQGNPH